MNLPSFLLGISAGLLDGLLAVGLVLVFRSNRFLNLAHGQLGALSALLLARLCIDAGFSYWVAFPLAIAVGAGTGVLIERLFVARLRRRTSSSVALLLLTIGLTQVLLAILYIPGLQPNQLTLQRDGYPLPFQAHFTVDRFRFGGDYILIVALAPVLMLGLAGFLRYSSLGKMIRAASANPDAALLCGISTRAVSAASWAIAGVLSAVSAILAAPGIGAFSAPSLGPDLLFVALGAAAFGAFESISQAFLGGLVIGIVEQVTIGITANVGTGRLVVFGLILAVVFVRGSAIGAAFSSGGAAIEDRPPVRIPAAVKDRWFVRHQTTLVRTAAITCAVLVPLLAGFQSESRRFQLTLVLLYAIVAVSLTALIGWGGQLSLGHMAVVGLGAFATARLSAHGWSTPAMLLFAGAVGALSLMVVGLPALRVRGLTLAVTTLGFAIVANEWLFRERWLTASSTPNLDVTPPGFLWRAGHVHSLLSVYYLALGVLVATVLALRALRRSTPGQLMIAVRDDERASASHGVTPATTKLTTLAMSGFVAGMVGVLWAVAWRTVTPDQFAPSMSLSLLSVPVVGGLGSVAGAVAAAAALYMPTFFIAPHLTSIFGRFTSQAAFQLAVSGLAIVGVLLRYPTGLAGAVQQAWERFLARVASQLDRRAVTGSPPALVVRDVCVRFGGVNALRDATIEVRAGEIVGLIGTNGAGKSTLLNVISGVIRAEDGSIEMYGVDLSGLAPDLRAMRGLGRGFQAATLFPGLTVRETVHAVLGARARIGVISTMLGLPWAHRAERQLDTETDALLERTGLTPWADHLTSTLSTGTRRICDLTLQLASRPRVLLLDEPTAGVAQRDTEQFGPLLRRIRDELDCSILIVEHDMPLLMGLCDRVYAMERGHVIAEGTPSDIRRDPAVIASYLGTDETAIARSGARPGRGRRSMNGSAHAADEEDAMTAGSPGRRGHR